MSIPPTPRNTRCPCGSGQRYKHCCGAATGRDASATAEQQAEAPADDFAAAQALHQAGRIDEAKRLYQGILELRPGDSAARHYLGVCCHQQGDREAAERHIAAALLLNEHEPMAHNNLGLVYLEQGRYQNARDCFDRALADDADNARAYNNRGLVEMEHGRLDEALSDFSRATQLRSDFAEAFANLANVLKVQLKHEEALLNCDRALALDAKLVLAHSIRGNVLYLLGRHEEAVFCCDHALALDSTLAAVHAIRATALMALRRLDDAATAYGHALALNYDAPYFLGNWLYARMSCCEWENFDAICHRITTAIDRGMAAVNPMMALALPITLAQQQRCARSYADERHPTTVDVATFRRRGPQDRIRIAYLSPDFRNHPVGQLIGGLIEQHDRSTFEVTGIYFGPDVTDEWRTRLEAGFDRFLDLRRHSDGEIAQRMRHLGIDIAVDLCGYTMHERHGIFALRPAPLQVNYLGYPGTLGASYIDYVIADSIVTPRADRHHYDEKIACMPHTYFVNDASKPIAEGRQSRGAHGLPEHGVVFCCFNSSYKITPDVFDIWMRLMRAVPTSVLWLLGGNPAAERNLRREAERRAISADRLVFAGRMALADHLARHRCADLFLDTFYYNAHTTASDALWAGLPVVTCLGETFAGRVAGSLLGAVGMPELIAHSHAEYEVLALDLAVHPDRLADVRRRLAEKRLKEPLFDTRLWTRHVEALYRRMLERHLAGLAPDHITVDTQGTRTASECWS